MSRNDTILLDHGSGGKLSHQLIDSLFLPAFDNPILSAGNDGGILEMEGLRLAFSTDSYVVDPIFFPGGCIGDLAVNGTVNDVAMCGAIPLYLSVGFILEEGFPMADLQRVVAAMHTAAETAGVRIVTGDTKVVPRGAADKIFINTSGVGRIPDKVRIDGNRAAPGDRILMSGTMADHGITVLTQREGLAFDAPVQSDSAALNGMVARMLERCPDIHVLRDPTRGGVGTTLNEIARQSGCGMRLFEDCLPVTDAVTGLCELLGLDPMYLANEGKLLAIVQPEDADAVLAVMQADPHGNKACCIGEVTAEPPGRVIMKTVIGGERMVDMLTGDQLPRIC